MTKVKKVVNLLKAAFTFSRPKRWGVISEIYQSTKFDAPISVSYSQGAEDLVLLHFLKKELGFYIDIRAHHPNRFSVTRLLYDRGWSGINVDANPDLKYEFSRWRPRDMFLNFAVGDSEEFRFTRFKESAISTINGVWRDQFIAKGNQVLDEISVPGITMRELFELVPLETDLDLVNLDVEGADLEALKSLGDTSRLPIKMPNWFLCETPEGVDDALRTDTVEFIVRLGYRPWAILPLSTLLKRI